MQKTEELIGKETLLQHAIGYEAEEGKPLRPDAAPTSNVTTQKPGLTSLDIAAEKDLGTTAGLVLGRNAGPSVTGNVNCTAVRHATHTVDELP
ncbi:hypothetical protein GP486_000102 [Trichoglossum hirsutum]|uniref:Uncharacterized protein n=1 Tax=Trichoglossum hirsutum TaxID=265104 RepID=A0A9P8LJL7_9PEZI|nr:hypothetical protein GP486_000102 [Trichoglossum hirsutum]